ncbi:MAG TPA: DUF47 family protein [Solirubrobacteraceae bacterium]|nr:DUF47 family protein [Solirubrobacteraceae bacterium]
MAKERIIRQLGEQELLLPSLVRDALAANDRVKYLLGLIQAAQAAADGGPVSDLREERIAAGVQDPSLDRTVAASARRPDGLYSIPGADRLVGRALAEVESMLEPLLAADAGAEVLDGRLATLRGRLDPDGDTISTDALTTMTAADRERDSLHLLVLDAHRQLNSVAAGLASETIDGASAHSLAPGDRELVSAFMRGVGATERLRFGHAGLAALATHVGDALVIEDELGLTDAHVVLVRVRAEAVAVTYTDVHLERLLFFQRRLAELGVEWEDTRSRADRQFESGLFHLATGSWHVEDRDSLERFLTALGSRLVFMIDWNRARKQLRALVGKRAAVALLDWAAEHGHGHRAFLIAGGDGLVLDALQFAGQTRAASGRSLSAVLGAPAATAYLRSVLRICSEGMLAGRSLALIQDEVRAELFGYVHTAREERLKLISRHGELVVEIAEAARDELERAVSEARPRPAGVAARRARDWEHEADAVLNRLRLSVERADGSGGLLEVMEAADDVADNLEDAAFYLTLLRPPGPANEIAAPLREMCSLLLASARAHLRAVTYAADVQQGASTADMDAFLEAVHAVVSLEHDADDVQRTVHVALIASALPAGELFALAEVTRAFEQAADALMHTALLLRDQVLGRAVRTQAPAGRTEPARPARVEVSPADADLYVLGEPGPLPALDAIGAKAHGLARIARAGLRVPEALVLTTDVSRRADASGSFPELGELTARTVAVLEASTGLGLGDRLRPLVLSVRSGAPVSMPGMLETVLDVGLSDATVSGLAAATGNPRLAWDCYRRLIESFATVVHGGSPEPFQQAVRERLSAAEVSQPVELEAQELRSLVAEHLERFRALTGEPFPDPRRQLEQAVSAVIRSWRSSKASAYRRLAGVSEDIGTAVILQRMVFGNAGGRSGTGVGFTRDPSLGASGLYVDFLVNAQGEDVVAGRQPLQVVDDATRMEPVLHEELERAAALLESQFGDAQEFEFTVQDGELFLLQTRTAKRTPWAALQIGVDQVAEGLITPAAARERLAGIDLSELVRRRVSESRERVTIARAVAAGSGVASGPIALDADAAARMADDGRPPVVVLREMSTDEIAAISRAAGILTAAGGRTSHAAVVARELGTPCLVGCRELAIDLDSRTLTLGSRTLAEGDVVTLDGESGLVYAGAVPVVEERPTHLLAAVEGWGNGRTSSAPEPAPPDGPRASTARAGS